MKRSEINSLIREAEVFFRGMGWNLPPWASRDPESWKGFEKAESEIADNGLGWDLTDFGLGDFSRRGLLLFTMRNGNPGRDQKPYAEKIMIVREEQETPLHFHWSKMEDIIVRGGGNLVLDLYGSTQDEKLSGESVTVSIDGAKHTIPSGGRVVLGPGESITLTQGLYHRFFGENGKGTVLVGEVSAVNDDASDNRFYEPVGRFPEIEEDEPPYRLLVSDYGRYRGVS